MSMVFQGSTARLHAPSLPMPPTSVLDGITVSRGSPLDEDDYRPVVVDGVKPSPASLGMTILCSRSSPLQYGVESARFFDRQSSPFLKRSKSRLLEGRGNGNEGGNETSATLCGHTVGSNSNETDLSYTQSIEGNNSDSEQKTCDEKHSNMVV